MGSRLVRCTARSTRICDGPGRPQDTWQEAARLPRPATAHAAWRGIRSERTHRHPSRCRRARRPDLVPLRYGRMLRSPFTLYRASVGDSLIALSLVAAKHAGRKTDLGLDAAQNPLVRHSLAKESGRRVRTKTVIPLSRGSCVVQLDHQQRCKKEKAPAASNGAISFRAALGDNRRPV